jgi:hypothetical protein
MNNLFCLVVLLVITTMMGSAVWYEYQRYRILKKLNEVYSK